MIHGIRGLFSSGCGFASLCCAIILLAICGCTKQPIADNRPEDERIIREMEIEAAEAIAAKDLGKLVSLYADDAALFHEHDPNISGKAAICETWKAIFARPGFAMSIELQKVEVSTDGDLAWTHGVYEMRMNDDTGKPVMDRGEYAVVYKKQPDGKWKIMADNGSTDLRAHALPKPPSRRSPYAPLAPLMGLACFLSGIWFLFGMPVVFVIYSWKFGKAAGCLQDFLWRPSCSSASSSQPTCYGDISQEAIGICPS